ncbi:MAG: hypothetical protein ACFFD4_33430 [Candidatus Odinarchaeota archaeon]
MIGNLLKEKERDSRTACIKEPPKSRSWYVKPVIIALLVFTLVIPPFLLMPSAKEGPDPEKPVPIDKLRPERVTSNNEIDNFVGREYVADLVQAADGGLVVFLTTQFGMTDDSDIMLVKLAEDGTVQWSKTYRQSDMDNAGALVLTNDNGFALAGYTTGWLPWVIKTDAGGNVEWNKTYDSKFIVSMVQTSDDGFALAFASAVLGKIDRTGEIEWTRNYKNIDEGNPEGWNQQVRDMVLTSDGGFALAGSISMVNKESDMWLAKTDSNGNVEWSRNFGGSRTDGNYFCNIIQTRDGGYALEGDSDGGILLVKTDSRGNMEWKYSYVSGFESISQTIFQTADDGYILAGGSRYSTIRDSSDAKLTKIASNGNIEWSQVYEESSDDSARAVIQTPDGGFALAGTSSFSLDVGFDNRDTFIRHINADTDAWLMKTDGNGNEEWKYVFDCRADEEWVTDVDQTADGGFIVTGPAGTIGGKLDAWIGKTDGNGMMTWNRSYGGPKDDIPAAIIQTADGGFAIAGSTSSWGAGNSDAWLIRTDENGLVTWNRSYGGPEDDGAEAVIQTEDGGFALAGFARFRGALDSDGWLIKIDGNGKVVWNQTFGGDKDDKILDLFQLANGSFVLLGYHGQELIAAECSVQTERHWAIFDDAWVLVVDENGILQREFVYEEEGIVRFHDIGSTGDGNGIIVAGLSTSQLDWSTGWRSDAGANSVVYLRFDDTGISRVERPLPYPVRDGDLVYTDNGDFVLTGYIASENDVAYLLLAKMDSDGLMQWNTSYKVEHKFSPLAWNYWFVGITSVLIQLDDGGYALASGVMSRSLSGDSVDAWLARFDENGTLAWEHAYGTGGVKTSSECYLCQAGPIILWSDNDSLDLALDLAPILPFVIILALLYILFVIMINVLMATDSTKHEHVGITICSCSKFAHGLASTSCSHCGQEFPASTVPGEETETRNEVNSKPLSLRI